MASDRPSHRGGPGPLASLTPEQQAAVVRIALMVHCRNDERRHRALASVLIEGTSIRTAARTHGFCFKTVARQLARFRDTLGRATAGSS